MTSSKYLLPAGKLASHPRVDKGEPAHVSVTIDVEYQGGLRTKARHRESGAEICTAVPGDGDRADECFSPTDLAAVSLATCLISVVATAARKHGVDPEGARVRLEKSMTESGPRRIAALHAVIEMPPGVPVELRKRLEAAAKTCPVHRSLHPDIDEVMRFEWRD